ncbi:hypothetical protein ACJJIE_00110 (plasmid) [Microbulbifer sp. TRSA001]|uniref:hypothetical protein n=1 Tax=Microbulbifer sp. TRSA001 TaxID=3243381 RepID=UPI0040392B48
MREKKSNSTAGSSARLHRLLDAQGFPPDGEGRVAAFARSFGVNTANASRWLNDDRVPRDMGELLRIATELGANPFWWAIGKGEEDTPEPEPFDITLFGRCANELLKQLQKLVDRPLDIDGNLLSSGYRELYEQAQNNGAILDPDRISLVAVKVLAEHRKK